MSNLLYNLAQEVTLVTGIDGKQRAPFASEMAVLLCLANDARDRDGGVTTKDLTTEVIRQRTRLSEAAVRKAYRVLQSSGHITRLPGEQGKMARTRVHPVVAKPKRETWVSPVQGTHSQKTGDPCIENRGPYRESNYNQDIQPEHHAHGRAREPAAPDEVDQLFDAWDAFLERTGQAGPATRSPARRMALRARLAEHGLGRLMMAIDQAERGYRAGKFNRAGQGDLWLTFDKVFEVGHAAALGLLARLLDQEFAPPAPKAEPSPAAPLPERAGEGEAVTRIRAAARATLGDHAYQAWLAPAALQLVDGELLITAPSAFAADWIGQNIAPKLRRPGMAVRVSVERISA